MKLNYKSLRLSQGISERTLNDLGVSRGTLRNIEQGQGNPTLESMEKLTKLLGKKLEILIVPQGDSSSEYSTIAVSLKVRNDGPDSWKIHFMEMVDETRKTLDPRLLILPPPKSLDPKLKALLASIVLSLCSELSLPVPDWASKSYFLPSPWFISEVESLKATSLQESPLEFKFNNIFVLGNFLSRA